MLEQELATLPHVEPGVEVSDDAKYSFVYLVRGHPGEYKIDRTNLVDRRMSELGATASIEQTLIHEIKTDDSAGIEVYWHRWYVGRRMKGEWFRLSVADVKTFKRWRRITSSQGQASSPLCIEQVCTTENCQF